MRDQYAGDISDLLKFAFLRALAGTERVLGVAWYYVPVHDGRADGRHLEWRNEPAWLTFDAQLHAGLSALPERSIAGLERAAIWPNGTVFHREPMPSRAGRNAWSAGKRAALEGADLVFLDPDNGLGRETKKHATFSEVRMLRRWGRAIVFISFPGRNKPHDEHLEELHRQLMQEAGTRNVVTLRTCVSLPRGDNSGYVPRQRWFTIVDADPRLYLTVRRFGKSLVASIPRVRARINASMSGKLNTSTWG
jgi:hypothetical protein